MPENLKSASLTASGESASDDGKGKIQEDEFMNGIVSMINETLCRAIPEEERNRFQTAREVIGKCPVCCLRDVYMKERPIITALTEAVSLLCGSRTAFWKV